MAMRRGIAGIILIALAGLLVVIIWHLGTICRAPVLNLVSMEPAGIVDHDGREMFLVTLRISYPGNRSRRRGSYLYLRDNGKPIEAKVANRWVTMDGTLG